MFSSTSAFNQVLCWGLSTVTTFGMFSASSGSANPSAPKCSCGVGTYYTGRPATRAPRQVHVVLCLPCGSIPAQHRPGLLHGAAGAVSRTNSRANTDWRAYTAPDPVCLPQ